MGGAVLVGLLLLLALAIGPRDGLHMPDEGDLTVSAAEDAPESAASGVASFPVEPGKDAERVSAPSRSPTGAGRDTEPQATASAVQGPRNSGNSGDSAVAAQPRSPARAPAAAGAGAAGQENGSSASSAAAAKPVEQWGVQIGSFASRANADRLSAWCREQGYGVQVVIRMGEDPPLYRVHVGPYVSRIEADSAKAELALRGRRGFVAGWED